jgi:acid-sensing ion channel, other
VSFAEKSTPVWEIPFPAVTICPETKATKNQIDFAKNYVMVHSGEKDNLTIDELRNLEAVAQICDPHLYTNTDPMKSGLKPEEIVPFVEKNNGFVE